MLLVCLSLVRVTLRADGSHASTLAKDDCQTVSRNDHMVTSSCPHKHKHKHKHKHTNISTKSVSHRSVSTTSRNVTPCSRWNHRCPNCLGKSVFSHEWSCLIVLSCVAQGGVPGPPRPSCTTCSTPTVMFPDAASIAVRLPLLPPHQMLPPPSYRN